jgi:Bacterial toxin 50
METFSVGYALLGVQIALLDVVAPELRVVVVDVCKEKQLLYIRFYYDGEVSEKLIDLWQCAITEASAGLGPDCLLDDGVERLDYPQEIPIRGRYAYLRKEPNKPITQSFSTTSIFIEREIVDFKEKIGFFVNPVSLERADTSWGVIHYAKDGCHIVPAKPASYNIEIFPLAYALLSIQRAILGTVTPELRAIVVDVDEANKVLYIRFYYDKDVSTKVLDGWECAITETVADCLDYALDEGIEKLPYPQKIPFRGRYAYLRKE